MINFIVVDDFKEITKKVEDIINKTMMRNATDYKIHVFNDYDSSFMNFIKKNMPNKIYILDIETKSASGLDIARVIRKDDYESVIMFITAHEELSGTVAREQLMALTFICKFDDFESKVREAIYKALKIIGKKSVLRFKNYSSVYTIPIDDILYITRDSIDRKCIIKTDYAAFKINKSLNEIRDMLNDDFVQSHRACIINEKRIQKINKRNKEIVFDNGEKIDLISNIYKRECV